MNTKFSLKTKLTINFTIIILITGIITDFVGTYLINEGVINQVQDKVKNDLNSAKEIWNNRIEQIKNVIYYSTLRNDIRSSLLRKDRKMLHKYLKEIREAGNFEILTITDNKGKVILRSRNPRVFNDSQANDQLVKKVLSKKEVIASPVIIKKNELEKEGKEFARQVYIKLVHTPKAKKRKVQDETSGMMLKAAAPILDKHGKLIGILYGGNLINRNYSLVDKIKNVVYRGEKYNEMDMGTATIFHYDLRISTNVMTSDGKRAIGTRVSEEVYNRVIGEGSQWIDRAFVVNAWYITAYEPIRDVDNKIIGILYVGLLEEKFVDFRNNILAILFSITIAGMVIALIISTIFSNAITKPINYLVKTSNQISNGNFAVNVDVRRKDEIGELEKTYNKMASALKERDDELRNAMNQLEKLSRMDSLTGIINRRAFAELAGSELERAKRNKQPFSVAYIDLDNFKAVNDNLGHSIGDRLLCSVTKTIKNNIRVIDIFARLGGDEFILLLSKTGAEPAYIVISKIQKILLDVMQENRWPVTFSIGLITFNTPPENVDELITKSDEVMYSAKQGGKNMIKHREINDLN